MTVANIKKITDAERRARLESTTAPPYEQACRGHDPNHEKNDGAFLDDKGELQWSENRSFTKKAHSPMTRTATASRQRTPLDA